MRLYVTGPVTGIEDDNRPAFEDARARLEHAGYTAFIPHDFIEAGTPWGRAMFISIGAMLANADAVAELDGEWQSRGASIEREIAEGSGIEVKRVAEWCELCL